MHNSRRNFANTICHYLYIERVFPNPKLNLVHLSKLKTAIQYKKKDISTVNF